ncbi:hypothetical protein R5H30_05535 [Sulfitobacter sp. D35]|uniref:hypothetical protein n=1 Tax=Sulfitobacter sp. D35 TaxID=3083252 RepID=UPI00296EC86A|nr:hypothetical protein [Sulfitobacter sp. D35]MDW4497434.1 hypothetical protein [Sulfitobacter sp. D35]
MMHASGEYCVYAFPWCRIRSNLLAGRNDYFEVIMKRSLTLACVLSLMATAAFPSSVGFSARVSGKADAPKFKIINTSDAARIKSITVVMGDKSYEFDRVGALRESFGGKTKLKKGSTKNGKGGTNKVKAKFRGFGAGEHIKFKGEIDEDGRASTTENYRKTLFKKGKVIVKFSDGTKLKQKLTVKKAEGDKTRKSKSYKFAKNTYIDSDPLAIVGVRPGGSNGGAGGAFGGGSNGGTIPGTDLIAMGGGSEGGSKVELVPNPLPAGGLLALSGLGALAMMRRRRRKS